MDDLIPADPSPYFARNKSVHYFSLPSNTSLWQRLLSSLWPLTWFTTCHSLINSSRCLLTCRRLCWCQQFLDIGDGMFSLWWEVCNSTPRIDNGVFEFYLSSSLCLCIVRYIGYAWSDSRMTFALRSVDWGGEAISVILIKWIIIKRCFLRRLHDQIWNLIFSLSQTHSCLQQPNPSDDFGGISLTTARFKKYLRENCSSEVFLQPPSNILQINA